jgi:hypothetical protein
MPEPEPDPHCAVAIPRRAAVDIMMKPLAIAIVCVPAGLNGKGVGMATAVHVNAHAHAKRNAMRSDTRVTSAGAKSKVSRGGVSQSQQGRCVGTSQSLVLVKTSRARNTSSFNKPSQHLTPTLRTLTMQAHSAVHEPSIQHDCHCGARGKQLWV